MPTRPIKTQQLTQRQRLAIELIVAGNSLVDVAKQLHLNRCTLSVWNNQPVFREETNQRRSEVMKESSLQLQAMAGTALDVLRKELTGGPHRVAVALRVLAMIGVEKILHQDVEKLLSNTDAVVGDDDRIAGRTHEELVDRDIQRLLAEKDRLMAAKSAG